MKQSQLRWIIGLMGFALLILIGFQWYWIRAVQQSNEVRFKQDVIESMQSVVEKLEKQEAMNWLNRRLNFQTKATAINSASTQIISNARDSVVSEISFDFLFFTESGGHQLSFSNKPFEVENESKDKGIDKGDPKTYALVESKAKIDSNQMREKVNLKSEMMVTVLEEMMVPRRLSTRFNPKQLDSLLQNELQDKGITIAYDYAVLEDENIRLLTLLHPQGKTALLSSGFRVNLFPGDVTGPRKELVIHFPDQSGFLNNKIWLSMASSGLLVLTIVFCFGYAVYTIMRQKKVSEMKNDFINNMTHELKTPIATIGLAVEALQDQSLAKNKTMMTRYLSMISDENLRLGSHVEKVLQVAQIEKDELNLEMEIVDLHGMIEQAIDKISLQVEKQSGQLDFIGKATKTMILADQIHLLNALINLLDNAIKYSLDAPKIIVRTENIGNEIQLSVKDHGIGITKETQKLIFQQFYRVHTGNIHDIKGFGLGLTYVKSIVEKMNGTIHMESEHGKGSIFYLNFPNEYE